MTTGDWPQRKPLNNVGTLLLKLDEGKVEDWMPIHVLRIIDVKIQIRRAQMPY